MFLVALARHRRGTTWTSCRAGWTTTGTLTSRSATGGNDSGCPDGRPRSCRPSPTAAASPAGEALAVQQTIAKHGALGAPMGLGLMLAAPTIATHGTREQIDRYSPISSPAARRGASSSASRAPGPTSPGSPQGQSTTATSGIVNGQKVWTSGGQIADLGMLLARTNPDVPKHQGITWFAIDMHQPRRRGAAPARDDRRRDVQRGLPHRCSRRRRRAHRRRQQRLGRRQHHASVGALGPGRGRRCACARRVDGPSRHGGGPLEKRAGDFVSSDPLTGQRQPRAAVDGGAKPLIDLARSLGRSDEPAIRQDLARLHTLSEIARYNTERQKAAKRGRRRHPRDRQLLEAQHGRSRAAQP